MSIHDGADDSIAEPPGQIVEHAVQLPGRADALGLVEAHPDGGGARRPEAKQPGVATRPGCATMDPCAGSGGQEGGGIPGGDRKSTRLNSSHVKISYAVFCLKK